MSEHVIPVLRAKQAEIGGHIVELEKWMAWFRSDLANINAAIRILPPGAEPGEIIETSWENHAKALIERAIDMTGT